MTNINFRGRVHATPSAATILVDGNEVFSGQVGVGQPLDTEITLASTNQAPGNPSVSISVTSGVITVGWAKSNGVNGYLDIRNNDILINGQPPEWPATPIVPMPGGTPQSPIWDGWFFEISAGETITFTLDVQDTPRAWAANTNYVAGDLLLYNNNLYQVIANCNSGASFNPAQFTAF